MNKIYNNSATALKHKTVSNVKKNYKEQSKIINANHININQTKGDSRQNPKAAATADIRKAKWTTAKAAIAKEKASATPAIDATTDERGIVYAPRQLVQIAPENLALNKCDYIYLSYYYDYYYYCL